MVSLASEETQGRWGGGGHSPRHTARHGRSGPEPCGSNAKAPPLTKHRRSCDDFRWGLGAAWER